MRDPYSLSGFLDSMADDKEHTFVEDGPLLEEAAAALRRCADLLRRSHAAFYLAGSDVAGGVAWRPRSLVMVSPEEIEWLRSFIEIKSEESPVL